MTTLAITGHRLGPKLGGYQPNPLGRAVQAALRAEMERIKPTKVISGMALGVDQWGAWIAVKMGVPFVAAVPHVGQADKWRWEQRMRYEDLLDLADKVETLADQYDPGCMQRRNEWMVQNCNVLLAVWDGEPKGGTWNCLQYAEKAGRDVVRIDPMELKV